MIRLTRKYRTKNLKLTIVNTFVVIKQNPPKLPPKKEHFHTYLEVTHCPLQTWNIWKPTCIYVNQSLWAIVGYLNQGSFLQKKTDVTQKSLPPYMVRAPALKLTSTSGSFLYFGIFCFCKKSWRSLAAGRWTKGWVQVEPTQTRRASPQMVKHQRT